MRVVRKGAIISRFKVQLSNPTGQDNPVKLNERSFYLDRGCAVSGKMSRWSIQIGFICLFVCAHSWSARAYDDHVVLPPTGEPAIVNSPGCGGTTLNTVRDALLQKGINAAISMTGYGTIAVVASQALMSNPNTANFIRGALGLNNGQSRCSVICTASPVPPGRDAWVTMRWAHNPAAEAGHSLMGKKDPERYGVRDCAGHGGIAFCGVGARLVMPDGKMCALVKNWSHDRTIIATIDVRD